MSKKPHTNIFQLLDIEDDVVDEDEEKIEKSQKIEKPKQPQTAVIDEKEEEGFSKIKKKIKQKKAPKPRFNYSIIIF